MSSNRSKIGVIGRFALFFGLGNVLVLFLWSLGPAGASVKWRFFGHGADKVKNEFRRVKAMNTSEQLMRTYLESGNHGSGGENFHLQSSNESVKAHEGEFLHDKSSTLLPNYTTNVRCDGTPQLLAFVASVPSNGEFRQAIRETWAKRAKTSLFRIQTIFLTGKIDSNSNSNETQNVLDEIKLHGDILMGDFVFDQKIKTTLPLLLGIRWALRECNNFQYLYFGSDDTVLNADRLFDRIHYCERNNISDSRTWMGRITTFFKVRGMSNNNLYFSYSEEDNSEYFPPFCNDKKGYVLTRYLAQEVIESVPRTFLLSFADVFLGMIAQERNWTLVNDNLFTSGVLQPKNICQEKFLVTMNAPRFPDGLRTFWNYMRNIKFLRNCPDPDLDHVLPAGVDNRPYLQKVLSYEYNNSHACYDEEGNPLDIFMVVLISTPPQHIHMRTAIRDTWCRARTVQGEIIRCLFVMGKMPSEGIHLKTHLRAESAKYKDLIRANFHESFQNLTLKVILGLKWITENCKHAKYFYKGDEDMFVNFNNIISFLKNLRSRGEAMTKFFIGSRMDTSVKYSLSNPGPAGNERYHVPDTMYLGHYYPPYCSGGGYVLSTDTVPDMYRASFNISLINIDDAFQGILAKRVGLSPIHHPGFKSWGGQMDACSLRANDTMTIHGIDKAPQKMYDVWKSYLSSTIDCNIQDVTKKNL